MSTTTEEVRPVRDDEDEQPTLRHTIALLTARDGDTEFSWDPRRPIEVNAARDHFAKLRAEGYMLYRVEGEERGEHIREFDPHAQRIMAMPQLQGG